MLRCSILALFFLVRLDLASSEDCIDELWTYYEGACYYFEPGKVNYTDAKVTCEGMDVGAYLVSVHSEEEQEFLNSQFGDVQYWLGLEASEGEWAWIDGTEFDYSNWQSTYSTAKCPIANNNVPSGKWTTITCNRKNLASQGTLCKYTLEGDEEGEETTTEAAPEGSCVDEQWTYYEGACYYFEAGKLNYTDAKGLCEGMEVGAFLVSVHSEEEQAFLNDQFGEVQYWLGLDASSGDWAWNDETEFDYSNWQSSFSATKCPIVNNNVPLGKWTTISCNRKNLPNQGALCKYYEAPEESTCEDNEDAPCEFLAPLCEEERWFDLMTDQCPNTCGRCPEEAECSDNEDAPCALLAYLCDVEEYQELLSEECPNTCNLCPSETECADEEGAPCELMAYLCESESYQELMAEKCPATCNLCEE